MANSHFVIKVNAGLRRVDTVPINVMPARHKQNFNTTSPKVFGNREAPAVLMAAEINS
jgi:hypothetical protein